MSFSAQTSEWGPYNGDGASTVFGFDNLVLEAADLQVYVDSTLKSYPADYSINGLGAPNGGTVVFNVAPAAGTKVTILRRTAQKQITKGQDFQSRSGASQEADLDRPNLTAQELWNHIKKRIPQLADSDFDGFTGKIPGKDARKNLYWAWDGIGNPVAIAAPPVISSVVSLSDDGAAVGPSFYIDRIRSAPAVYDLAGRIVLRAHNGTLLQEYFNIELTQGNPFQGGTINDAMVKFNVRNLGDYTNELIMGGGLSIGGATNGPQGRGRVNAEGYYLNAVQALSAGMAQFTGAATGLDALKLFNLINPGFGATFTDPFTVIDAYHCYTLTLEPAPASMVVTVNAPASYTQNNMTVALRNRGAGGRAAFISIASGGTSFWLYPGQSAVLRRDGSTWIITRDQRWKLTSAKTVYVNPSTGNDNNDGLASGAALATFAAARDRVCKDFDFGTFNVTIKLADANYTAQLLVDWVHTWVGSGDLIIEGNTTTPANVLISTTSQNAVQVIGKKPGRVRLRGMKITTTTAGHGLLSYQGAFVSIGSNMEIGATAWSQMAAQHDGIIDVESNYTINGGASIHWEADQRGMVVCGGKTITLTGTPAYTNQFARSIAAVVDVGGNTFSGAATGTRYSATENGVIRVNGGGATYLPGSVAGSVATGGQYN